MRVQEHLGLLGWTAADKGLYLIYGLVTLLQVNMMSPDSLALFQILLGFVTFSGIIGDSLGLLASIQFGMELNNRRRANLFAIVMYSISVIIPSLILWAFSSEFASFFGDERLAEIGKALFFINILTIPRIFAIKLFYRDHEMKSLFLSNTAYFGVLTAGTFYFFFVTRKIDFSDVAALYMSSNALGSLAGFLLKRDGFEFGVKGVTSPKTMLKFALPNALSNLLHAVPRNMDTLALKYFFDTTTVGVYAAARVLFRLLDDSLGAINALVYPSYLKFKLKNDRKALNDMTTKAVSFLLAFFVLIILSAQLGLTEWGVNAFLPEKYSRAIGFFNMLLWAGLFMPFTVMYSGIVAMTEMTRATLTLIISVTVYLAVTIVVGTNGAAELLPLGLTLYYTVFGLICFRWGAKRLDFKPAQVFRALPDTYAFGKRFIEKRMKTK